MGLFSSIGSALGSLAGDLWEDEQTRSYNKKNYKYNSWLQSQNEEFQKYMAENAHQIEMADLQKAGLNPALTTTGSSAGSIAGSSAGASTSSSGGMQIGNIIDAINNTRMTNANVNSLEKNADANMINAKANMTNAKTGVLVGKSTAKFNDERTRGTSTKGVSLGKWGTFGLTN